MLILKGSPINLKLYHYFKYNFTWDFSMNGHNFDHFFSSILCPDGLNLCRLYIGSICLPILLIAVAAMILCVAQTCVLIVEYIHPMYQMNPLKSSVRIFFFVIWCCSVAFWLFWPFWKSFVLLVHYFAITAKFCCEGEIIQASYHNIIIFILLSFVCSF